MTKRQRQTMFLLWAATAGAMAASAPYLSTVGPPSLRFQPAPAPVADQPVLPPLPTPANPSGLSESTAAPITPANDPEPESTVTTATSPPLLVPLLPGTNAVIISDTNAPTGALPEPTLVTPDLLLRYFLPNTNAPATTVIVPGAATPIAPVFTPPSRATYSTSP